MKLSTSLLLAFAALGPALAPPASAQVVREVPHQRVPDFLGYVPDELVVVLRPEVRRDIVVSQDVSGRPLVNRASLQTLLDQHAATAFGRQFAGARPQPPTSPYPDLTGYYKVRISPAIGLDAAVAAFEADPAVEHVERIGIHSLYGEPNDPYYKGSPDASFPYDQWHLWSVHSIDAELAWDVQTGSPDVLVGILDSGVRYFHVDLGGNVPVWGPNNPPPGGNIFVNPGEVPGSGQDNDGNGYVDDTIGWDFVATAGGAGVSCIDQDCGGADNDPDDGDGHGTHVAGTVGAITDNGILVSGVAGGFGAGAPGTKIVPLRIGYRARYQGIITGVVRMDYAAEAMVYLAQLVDAGHAVASANCSWGSSNSGGLNAAVDALQAREVLIVAAAGNSNSTSAPFLGTKAGVMNVSATTINGNGASFTNHGSWVDVAAPGLDILSTYRSATDTNVNAHYIAVLSGTSMAAPHVAGIAALLQACSPGLTRQQKFALIVGNVDPYSDSRNLGSGIANAAKALAASGCSGGTPCSIVAGFSASPTTGCAPLEVAFQNTSSAGATAWSWSFGDGSTSTAQHPSHTYPAAGTYTVSLTAMDGTCSDTSTQQGYVSVGAVPIADFSATPTAGTAPLQVAFTSLTSGNPTTWAWNFGDGATSSAQQPVHTYATPGTYSVSLTVTNACGTDSLTKSDYITVAEPTTPSGMYVASIVVVRENLAQGNKRARATVTVRDAGGALVAGANVTGNFTGPTTNTGLTAVTGSSGQAVLFSSSVKGGGGDWCFEVTSVTHATLSYDAGSNAVTQSCESGDAF